VDADFQAELNYEIQSPRAKAYFNLAMVGLGHEPDTTVAEAIKHELYQPTMFMIGVGEQTRDTLGHIFDEGNGYGNGDLSVEHIRKHSSMSVGDLVVNLLDGSVQVCMPMGWYELFDTTLTFNIA
tara:strand:- start:90 stop:464 length:375 start_codon:yes stop_codon:yes gene_type:complete